MSIRGVSTSQRGKILRRLQTGLELHQSWWRVFPQNHFPSSSLLYFTHMHTHVCRYTRWYYTIDFFLKNLCFLRSFFDSDMSPKGSLWFKSLGYQKPVPRDAEQPGKEGFRHPAPAWQKPWLEPTSPHPTQNIFLELFDL